MQINPPIALIIINIPPSFALCFTTTEPIIPKIENSKANHPKELIVEAPLAPKAPPIPPTARAIKEPKNPNIPPINPKTNSVVLLPMIVIVEITCL